MLKVTFNVILFTCVIGLAISYITQLLSPYMPSLNFLEAVGVYCLWTPMHHALTLFFRNKNIEE